MTIAGSDPSGGAGIQADLKTFAALGVYGACAVTAITSQNTKELADVYPVPPATVTRQIETVLSDMAPGAIKTGMMAEANIVAAVADALLKFGVKHLIVDPVLSASTGGALLNPDAMETMTRRLFPIALLVTPNTKEAEAITGIKADSVDTMKKAAAVLVAKGAANAVVTGGHVEGETVTDVLLHEGHFEIFTRERVANPHTHGSGCTFSAAVAAHIAMGADLVEAVRNAGLFVANAIANAFPVGGGEGPVNQFGEIYRGLGKRKK